MHKKIEHNKIIKMASQYYGEGEGQEHINAKNFLLNFFAGSEMDTEIVWIENGTEKRHMIKWGDYDFIEQERTIGRIRPDITLFKIINGKKIPIYFFEIFVSNQIDPNKEKKIQTLKKKYRTLQVFELKSDMVYNLCNDFANSVQYGGGKYYILRAERKI